MTYCTFIHIPMDVCNKILKYLFLIRVEILDAKISLINIKRLVKKLINIFAIKFIYIIINIGKLPVTNVLRRFTSAPSSSNVSNYFFVISCIYFWSKFFTINLYKEI